MTKEEALILLSNAPMGDRPSKINPSLTLTQVVDIIRGAIDERYPENLASLDRILEKRVLQAVQNRKHPKL